MADSIQLWRCDGCGAGEWNLSKLDATVAHGMAHAGCKNDGHWRKGGAVTEREGDKFRFGNYLHYKGGLYTALVLAEHHETRRVFVVYLNHKTGKLNLRPLMKIPFGSTERLEDELDNDAWNDWVEHEGQRIRRFTYVGPST